MSQLTARDLSSRLAARAEDVARHLLGGNGKRQGHELRFGSLAGDEGQSLGVHLVGDKAGIWSDFAAGESGDLLDLWAQVRSVTLGEAMVQAKKYLGLEDVQTQFAARRPAARVVAIPRPEGVHALQADAKAFLCGTRGVSMEAATAYKLAQCRDEIVFPLLNRAGDLINTKFRRFPTDGIRTAAGGGKCLFGWQAIPANARSVVICEGEYKALLWFDYGYPALSVPFGAGKGKQEWIEADYDSLAQFDTIYLAMDEDENGQISTDEMVQRLGVERCAVVELPLPEGGKDIQSCARANVTAERIKAAILRAQPRAPEELKSVSAYCDEVVAMFTDTGPEPGLRTPWKKIGDDLVFRDGELTIVAGRTGHGKSQLVGFLICYALKCGYRMCVASFEFKVKGWLFRLIRQLTALYQPAPGYAGRIVDWLADGRMWAFDAQGTANADRMLDVFRYCRRRHGVTFFVVDNLTGLGIGEDDYQRQKEVIQALSNFTRDESCHVFLVHHIRKAQNQNTNDAIPDQGEIKGSGTIVDLASTVLQVWRNKRKERQIKELPDGAEMPQDLIDMPDVVVNCSKQRNYYGLGNGEPSIALWWDAGTFHYLARPVHRPRSFVTLEPGVSSQPPSVSDVPDFIRRATQGGG